MTDRNNDDLAAALAGLRSGDHHDPDEQAHGTSHGEHVHLEGAHESPGAAGPSAPQQAPVPAPSPAAAEFRAGSGLRPGGVPPSSPAPPAPRGGRPAAPAGSGGARPAGPGAPPSPPASSNPPAAPAPRAAPPRPVRPSAPSVRPATPTARRERPAAPARPAGPVRPASPSAPVRPAAPAGVPVGPTAPPPAAAPVDPGAHDRDVAQQADAMAHVVEDEDAVMVPPPPMEYLGHTHPHHPHYAGPARAAAPGYQNLEYRRTLIPIMLTTGLCLIVMGFTKWVCAPDTLLGAQPIWMTIAWFVFGGLAVLLGLLNMFQVKAVMDAAPDGRA